MVKKKDADVEDVEENREQMPIRPQPSKIQVVVLTLGLSLLVLFAPLPRLNGQTDIIPDGIWPMDVGTVDWKACADVDDIPGSECGYIIVPKDYFDPSAGTASIALGRLRASSKNSKGTVLFNPGGPGGAGKPFVTKRGNLLQNYIGEEYDLVGFDPRGIGETFKDFSFGNFKRNTVLERSYDFAPNGTFEEIREVLLVQQRESNSLLETTFDVCRETMGEELKYMGTATVVRDMDYITAALDGPDALINFYGGSYGSILGQYLVNMLPDRIGRVAIDGIADAVAWSEKPSYQWYRQWLVSSENNYDQFVDGCSATGRPACPLARHKGENPSLIKDRIESFINELYYNPLPVPHARLPGVLTSGRARGYVQLLLQRPITWPKAAFDIASAINGDGSFILNAMEPNMYRDLERSAVSCNDNPPFALANVRPEDVVDELLYVYQNVSHFVFNVVTAEPDAGCQFWPVTPPERFQGPWNNTLSNPILVLSNTEDPVTPMDSALKVQDLLGESARLLLQDGPGHVTLALPSFCTASHVQAFFSNGTLPPKGTVCKPDVTPFPTVTDHSILYSSDQEQILMSMTSLHDAMMDAVSPYKAPPTVDGKCVKSESGKVAQAVKPPTAMLRPAQLANDWSVSGIVMVMDLI
ncbi:hypothetical protein EUX98_g5194 [Antrodiella citrinella]|uniref:AB hydrolase-1 domain-containing protein n=1 Tax=Antrodiella citrinella TaxID=2447956 RepID=A0A4S4MUW4_9APHY|nr:hypothetical protein EUX98_g5194 [Antrodiella citrinella]